MDIKDWLGEDNKLGIDIWEKKYQYNGEGFEQWLDRVSSGNQKIRELIKSKKFLFGGRILANRGVPGKKTLSNCYVITPPEDNLESIFDTAKKLARTFSYGGGCGIDIGKLCPKDAKVNNTAKKSSGAVSFMDLYNTTTGLIGQNGRRGALMLSIPVNHPDVEDFIGIKSDLNKITNANISVRVDNKFMVAVLNDGDYELRFERPESGEVISKTVKAKQLFHKLCEMNWNYAEPGILFWDEIEGRNLLVNDKNFMYAGTNPCAEEPLPAGGSCLLGAINLSEFVEKPFTQESYFNVKSFSEAVEDAVVALNEVLDEGLSLHPLEEQRNSVRDWRQIGLGIMGLADCLIKLGYVYGSNDANMMCESLASLMFSNALSASAKLGEEFGSYPMFNREAVNTSPMVVESGKFVQELHNSQLLTVAPTGSISTMIGVSGGIEPIFANSYTRRTQSLHGKKEDVTYKVYTPIVKAYMDIYGLKDESELPPPFVVASDISPDNRIKCQSSWQKWIDASISSTINLPNEATVEDVEGIYINAWKNGLKGVTVYRAGCAREGILVSDKDKKESSNDNVEKKCSCADCKCENENHSVSYNSITPTSRKSMGTTSGCTYCKKSACGTLYITINKDSNGNVVESFVNASKGGICQSNINALNRMISVALRSGVKVEEVVDQLKGITCPACIKNIGKGKKLDGISCPDIIAKTLLDFYKSKGMIKEVEKNEEPKSERTEQNDDVKNGADKKDVNKITRANQCPDCGEELIHDGGCVVCGNCGWSKCG